MPFEVECHTVSHLKALTCGIEHRSGHVQASNFRWQKNSLKSTHFTSYTDQMTVSFDRIFTWCDIPQINKLLIPVSNLMQKYQSRSQFLLGKNVFLVFRPSSCRSWYPCGLCELPHNKMLFMKGNKTWLNCFRKRTLTSWGLRCLLRWPNCIGKKEMS